MPDKKTSNLVPSIVFKDLDRLYTIMDQLELDRKIVDPILEAFSNDMNMVYEFSIGNSESLGIMILVAGKSNYQRLAKFMEESGMAPEEIEYFLNCGESFGYNSVFFKIDFSKEGVEEISYYYRTKLSLEDLQIWLTSCRITVEEQERLLIIARFLDKEYAQVGVSLTPGEAGAEKAYFNIQGHFSNWSKIGAAIKTVLNIPDTIITDLFNEYFTHNKQHLYFAVGFKDQHLIPVVQLGVYGVEKQLADTIYQRFGQDQAIIQSIDYLFETSEKQNIDYLSFKIAPQGIQSIKTYSHKEYVKDYLV